MKTKLVAEIGVNAGGNLDHAKRLIYAAYQANADYVKFQKRNPRASTPKHMWDVPKETPWGTVEPYIEYREKAEFSKSDYDEIDRYCKELGIWWFASAWDEDSVDFLNQYDCHYIKIPSALALDFDLVDYARTAKPLSERRLIVSTGMCDNYELLTIAVRIPEHEGHFLMVCHSEYPVKDEREINLRQITTYQHNFPGLRIGFSSHSDSPYPAIYSSLLGSELVEVHITENRSLKWGDNPASLEPAGVALIARELARIDNIMGDGLKRLYASENKARLKLRGY